MSVIVIDVDNFKQINDRHGHATGDAALKLIAQRLGRHVREFDVLGRIGGEEFAILLPGLDTSEALEVAERLRHEIELPCDSIAVDPPLQLTISLGIAEVHAEARTIDAALSEADHAMYGAKSKGRNRIEIKQHDRPT